MKATKSKKRGTHHLTRVMNALIAAGEPLTAYQVLAAVRDDGLRFPSQIYRALDRLVARGLVHRLDSVNAFVVCSCPHTDHRGVKTFTICDSCGAVQEMTSPTLDRSIHEAARATAFAAAHSSIEIRGVCQACQKQQDSPPTPI
ncbi:transcriptional repressor [Salinisphaera sp. Q1T1-3]|nr:transcriptional repressor [Salinisphaera sp. Q1T1-3]